MKPTIKAQEPQVEPKTHSNRATNLASETIRSLTEENLLLRNQVSEIAGVLEHLKKRVSVLEKEKQLPPSKQSGEVACSGIEQSRSSLVSNRADKCLEEALEHLKKREYSEAIENCTRALSIAESSNAYKLRGDAHYNLGNFSEAILDYDFAIVLDNNDANTYLRRASALFNTKDYTGAFLDCNQAVSVNPQCNSAYNFRGLARLRLRDYQGALADYTHALSINPAWNEGRKNISTIIAPGVATLYLVCEISLLPQLSARHQFRQQENGKLSGLPSCVKKSSDYSEAAPSPNGKVGQVLQNSTVQASAHRGHRTPSTPSTSVVRDTLPFGTKPPRETRPEMSPCLRAFLDVIALAEVGTVDESGYQSLVYSGKVYSYAQHPNILKCADIHEKQTCSTAAGRYQFLNTTWNALAMRLGLKDFSPYNQDLAAIELIREKGALPYIEAGEFQTAFLLVNTIWAGLPGSPHNQNPIDESTALQFARERLMFYTKQL